MRVPSTSKPITGSLNSRKPSRSSTKWRSPSTWTLNLPWIYSRWWSSWWISTGRVKWVGRLQCFLTVWEEYHQATQWTRKSAWVLSWVLTPGGPSNLQHRTKWGPSPSKKITRLKTKSEKKMMKKKCKKPKAISVTPTRIIGN